MSVVSSPQPAKRELTQLDRANLFHGAVAIVEVEYAGDLGLDEVARRVACSRRQLQRCYAEIGETTYRTHLIATRMQRAAELLAESAMTVRDVADSVGYRQPAQFAKAFRRHYGMTPTAFRQR
jgi:AraC family transcriptional regulator of adaptative response / methylphosphotriester-DNA alkyltransferase methyltransferase